MSSRLIPPHVTVLFSLLITTLTITTTIAGASKGSPAAASTSEPMASLWVEPADIAARDLFYGRGGSRLAPRPEVVYRFRDLDTRGHSGGYDVEDPKGRRWDVKIGDEAQSETVVSRILWAIGYHQPVIHYVPRWRMTGGPTPAPDPGRFRLETDHEKAGEWSWKSNPFAGTRPFRGLLVANWLLNNWDLATSQNRIYKVKDSSGRGAEWFVVQDLGAALGKGGWPLGTRNAVADFESQGFVEGVEKGRVRFDYDSRHGDLLKQITPADVVWTCRLMSRLTDRQLDDAFRAAGYPPEVRGRFIQKIREKIRQGLALQTPDGSGS
ncbi:MAG TPA: hypothetical protein VJV75_04235 [Candidatus Polarisedimenticolia bacterium]|nr:hypothetical protein [Candidatus Polarisedimenticolia bacterium]